MMFVQPCVLAVGHIRPQTHALVKPEDFLSCCRLFGTTETLTSHLQAKYLPFLLTLTCSVCLCSCVRKV